MDLKTITQEELNIILEEHHKWLKNKRYGKCANLSNYELISFDFSGLVLDHISFENSVLKKINFTNSSLKKTNFCNTKIINSEFKEANLTDANFVLASLKSTSFFEANLTKTIFRYSKCSSNNFNTAILTDADFAYADCAYSNFKKAKLNNILFIHANLYNASFIDCKILKTKYPKIDDGTAFFALQCPEEGAFVGFKKSYDDKIIKLLIMKDSLRSSATSRKCRASKVKVLAITDFKGKMQFEKTYSNYDRSFVYKVGDIIEIKKFNKDRWEECSNGIHFFITREEAIQY